MTLTRRSFLATTGAVAIAAALPVVRQQTSVVKEMAEAQGLYSKELSRILHEMRPTMPMFNGSYVAYVHPEIAKAIHG